MVYKLIGRKVRPGSSWVPQAVALLVAITGLITISSTLDALIHLHRSQIVDADAHTTLLAGLSLIYLATLLRRGKRSAWLVSLPIFVFLLARNIRHFDYDISGNEMYNLGYFLNIFLPVLILAILILGRRLFDVRSEIRSFTTAIRRSALILLVAFLYGSIGFQLLDKRDFHQEIALQTGAHYTIDQFGLTTSKQLEPQTRRAHLFLDSLAVISLGSLFYVVVSFSSPIRFRLVSHQQDYDDIASLLKKYPSNSEDFFKLWPPDKAYLFSSLRQAALAYRSVNGIALAVGDPAGNKRLFNDLLSSFGILCRLNDWQPSFIHTLQNNLKIYEKYGFESQKIGEEAIVDIQKFNQNVANNKYFRHISNKFTKQGFFCEILQPPHNDSVLARLREISDDWLKVPGRGERGFMMGYFSDAYIQQCTVMVVRDAAGTMQAFVNQLPTYDAEEANYDFLRHTRKSLGNINDFLMVNFIAYLKSAGYKKLNMGLCPLSGLDQDTVSDPGLLDNLLNLVYSNSSRFYSFKGLRRFKEKYEPEWRPRYIVYQGGFVGLTKTANALVRAMRVKKLD